MNPFEIYLVVASLLGWGFALLMYWEWGKHQKWARQALAEAHEHNKYTLEVLENQAELYHLLFRRMMPGRPTSFTGVDSAGSLEPELDTAAAVVEAARAAGPDASPADKALIFGAALKRIQAAGFSCDSVIFAAQVLSALGEGDSLRVHTRPDGFIVVEGIEDVLEDEADA